jgi:hypothetical protein
MINAVMSSQHPQQTTDQSSVIGIYKRMSPLPTIERATLGGVSSGFEGEIGGTYPSNPLHMQVTEPSSSLSLHHHHHQNHHPAAFTHDFSDERRKQPSNDDGVKDEPNSAPTKKRRTSSVYDETVLPASAEAIEIYEEQDVLSGRGGGTNAHPGNRRFRDLIHVHRRNYLKARKNDKPAISRAIVKSLRDGGGRFLKRVKDHWVEIGDFAAREKTSQALRQRAPEMRQLLFEADHANNAAVAAANGMAPPANAVGPPPMIRETPAATSAVVVGGGHHDGSHAPPHHHHHHHQGMYVANNVVHHPHMGGNVVHHMGQVYAVAPPAAATFNHGVQVLNHHHILPAPHPANHHTPISVHPSTQHYQANHQIAYQI